MRAPYGTTVDDRGRPHEGIAEANVLLPHKRQRKAAERRLAIVGALLMGSIILAAIVLRINPERRAVQQRVKGRVDVLRSALVALGRAWGEEGSGIKVPESSLLLSGDCCDPDLCSKYALEACSAKKAGQTQIPESFSSPQPPPSQNDDDTEGGSADDGLEVSSIPENQPPTFAASRGRGRATTGVARRHPGAAEAAAALGLNLVSGGSSAPLRSYFGEKRDAEQAAEARHNSDSDEGPPPATVGLVTRKRIKHGGALRAAEAFGLHVSNLEGGSQADVRTEKLLQVAPRQGHALADEEVFAHADSTTEKVLQVAPRMMGTPAEKEVQPRLEQLADIFSAPVDIVDSAFKQAMRAAQRQRSSERSVADEGGWQSTAAAQDRDERAIDVFQTATSGVLSAARRDHTNSIYAFGGGMVSSTARRNHANSADVQGGGMQTEQAPSRRVNLAYARGGDDEGYITKINFRGGVGRRGTVTFPGNLDSRGHKIPAKTADGPDQDTKILNVGALNPTGAGYETNNYQPPTWAPGASVWHAQDGWQQGNQDHIASITISPPVQPPVGKAHLTLEVYCPPYKAPSHGSVWYKGVEYRDSTSPGAIEGKRKTWRVGGKDLPIARSGDIREGVQVRLSCDVHYELSTEGSVMPRCLSSGEWEKGKTCEPIMCDAYKPPAHGSVWPDTPVQAGQTVTINCDRGYLEYSGEVSEAVEDKARAAVEKKKKKDPWWDFNAWFGGVNQGLQEGHKLSKRAGPATARASVLALSGLEKGQQKGLNRGRIANKLAKLKKKEEEVKRNNLEVPLSKAIGHMTKSQVDAVVRKFVFGPSVEKASTSSSSQMASSRRLLQDDTADQSSFPSADQPTPSVGRRLLQERGEEDASGSVLGHKSPMCLDTRKFEKGITCRAPSVSRPSNTYTAPPDTYKAPPKRQVEIPVVCPSYIAPEHGSVILDGEEHRIATQSGVRAGGWVEVKCHKHYRPSKIGTTLPKCLWSGEWEVGASCERISCGSYILPKHSHATVNTDAEVLSGSRVHITCDDYYTFREEDYGAHDPMCLDTGRFETAAVCVPKPCPKEPGPTPCFNSGAHGGVTSTGIVENPTRKDIRDWEDEVEHHNIFDYAPNVFDHEPRPTTWQ